MVSTFHGLEVAKRGLFTQQSALYTTGHNISNANTEGYTRQRVNMEQTSPFPPASRNRPEMAGQIGSGVQAGSVERVRDAFLDDQFRAEAKKTGYYDALENGLGKMEEIMNEPTDQGLAKTMDRFWQSLQDLAVNPEDAGARSVVMERGKAVAETFNYLSESVQTLQQDAKQEAEVTVQNANSMLNQINQLNQQIGNIEPHGQLPNDLYDKRDRLLDDLSKIVSIDVSYDKSASSSKEMADGIATVRLADEQGRALEDAPALVNGPEETVNQLSINYQESDDRVVFDSLQLGQAPEGEDGEGEEAYALSMNDFPAPGKLKGLADLAGMVTETPRDPAYTVTGAVPVDNDTQAATLSSISNGEEELGMTITGTYIDGEGNPQDIDVPLDGLNGDSTLSEIAAQINGNEGIQAEVLDQDGERRLAISTTSQGEGSTFTVAGNGAELLGIAGEHQGTNEQEGSYVSMLNDLDTLASSFANQFNSAHKDGTSLEDMGEDANGSLGFFDYGSSFPVGAPPEEGDPETRIYRGMASDMGVIDSITEDVANIAASLSDNAGDGENARELADIQTQVDDALGEGANINSFYEGMIGGMAVETQEARRMSENSETLRNSVENQRNSVSQVSLDEEMTNMIKFQHAYNASSRNITAIDEILDRVINQMGRVGR
ncbi:flagellar hook-associated protein FlgK [Salimicrobium halophilum]|uniref:Flagellar hook-associated protein 1 n=1 Tax=Salimicrobium halophilum TaxID=86666 RepID=A0A1G8S0R0_9BACI|nr:flagellar hook-associated protein FlgK [Salimicrobium halophilum]SDJ22385.1 flagellar hook-associated protein 1 FlgK [Salimicrobium halophilum]